MGKMNEYQQAIISISQILLNYDSTKKIKTYGFGGAPSFPGGVNTNNKCCHFFPCSGDPNNSEGDGVNGVFQLYNHALHHTRLSGPTFFNPLMKETGSFCKSYHKLHPDNYSVLLIITDGIIHDMADTIDTIVD
jgi:hypothetical protein